MAMVEWPEEPELTVHLSCLLEKIRAKDRSGLNDGLRGGCG